jgi:hypothetical protein
MELPETIPQMIWSKITTEGYIPEARHSHSGTVVTTPSGDASLVVFGGVVAGRRVNTTAVFEHGAILHMLDCRAFLVKLRNVC